MCSVGIFIRPHLGAFRLFCQATSPDQSPVTYYFIAARPDCCVLYKGWRVTCVVGVVQSGTKSVGWCLSCWGMWKQVTIISQRTFSPLSLYSRRSENETHTHRLLLTIYSRRLVSVWTVWHNNHTRNNTAINYIHGAALKMTQQYA